MPSPTGGTSRPRSAARRPVFGMPRVRVTACRRRDGGRPRQRRRGAGPAGHNPSARPHTRPAAARITEPADQTPDLTLLVRDPLHLRRPIPLSQGRDHDRVLETSIPRYTSSAGAAAPDMTPGSFPPSRRRKLVPGEGMGPLGTGGHQTATWPTEVPCSFPNGPATPDRDLLAAPPESDAAM